MCGPTSAIGLGDAERWMWPLVRERLRQPGRLMGLMRGVLGGDAEVAAVVAATPAGVVQPLALLVTPAIAQELTLTDEAVDGVRRAKVGDYEVEVLMGDTGDGPFPAAVLVTPWIFENLTLYSRKLWSRR